MKISFLRRLFAGTLSGDVNLDGSLDMDDAIYLLFHINFSDAYPLH